MKQCNFQDFMQELKPWLDSDHIKKAEISAEGIFYLYFNDGMKNVYALDDCTMSQVQSVVDDLKTRGVIVDEA